jgi:hypothetical protein
VGVGVRGRGAEKAARRGATQRELQLHRGELHEKKR